MIKTFTAVAIAASALMSCGVAAQAADQFYAAPMNSGPPTLGAVGERFPPAAVVMTVVNGVTQPVLQPLLAPGPAPMAPMMMKHHRHHHMRMMKHSMKKKMMMK